MNGAIMGMSKAEISRKLDEIVDFAGVERYLDTPVKRYSSGMTVRLGFAIAAHLDPEILVVDEVLAVGDAEFQKKAIGKMQDVSQGEGRTVLFVSHNMASIKQLCKNGLLLKDGTIESIGLVSDIISEYLIDNTQENAIWERTQLISSDIYFNEIKVLNSKGNLTSTIETEEDFEIQMTMFSSELNEEATVAIRFENEESIPIFTTSLHDCSDVKHIIQGGFKVSALISKNILVPGKYKLIIACFISGKILYDIVEEIKISVEDVGVNKKDKHRLGLVVPNYEWKFHI
jgi:lipopolysaccharide transport system ATP-binding protein